MNIALDRQIACAKRELAMRRATYPRLIAAKRMSPTSADVEIEGMEAIIATLEWLERNENDIRGYVAERKALRGDPAVQKIIEAWPDAGFSVRAAEPVAQEGE